MTTFTDAPTLGAYLGAPLRAGAPDVRGPLAVYPLFGPDPALAYLPLAAALPLGVAVTEVAGAADVRTIAVENPTEHAVLLYEGEELLGAQQNRTLDTSILVAPGTRTLVPVSCVEAGRWDGRRHHERFRPAAQAANPDLRRRKHLAASRAVRAGAAPRADQAEVWAEVRGKSDRMQVDAPTGALHDVYEAHRDRLGALVAAIPLHPGQQGALVALGGRLEVLDRVSRPDAWAVLHGPLVQGYALDALERRPAGDPPAVTTAQALLDRMCVLPVAEHDGIGLGRDVRFEAGEATGGGLVSGDELIQLTAFIGSGGGAAHVPGGPAAIRRPSARRR